MLDGLGAPDEPTPEWPRDADVRAPDLPVPRIEPARLLENEARDRLRADGFTDEQIIRWVDAYFAEHSEGSVDELIAWIREQERTAGTA